MFYFWGLSIETVTATCLTISIGLCIDYAAHIGSMFMTVQGLFFKENDKDKKEKKGWEKKKNNADTGPIVAKSLEFS